MTARVIDGRARAARLRQDIAAEVARLRGETGRSPSLAVVLVGEDPASQVYVRSKIKAAEEVGITSFSHHLAPSVSEQELLRLIAEMNADPKVNGILVQLPLPTHINRAAVINAIDPAKDVDGFHIANVGALATGQAGMVPCTPLGCLMLLHEVIPDLKGKIATVVGCSNIVGRPMAELLLKHDATVLIAHKSTPDTAAIVRQADIVVCAAGVPGLIRGDWVKPGAVVIDVGINRVPAPELGADATKLVGDVAYEEAQGHAAAITPVPGGVGPMTIACLLANTLTAFCAQTAQVKPTCLAA